MLGPNGVISVKESTKLVKCLFSCCEETSSSCCPSWIAHWLFRGMLVLLYNFVGKVVERQPTISLLH